MAHNSYAVVIRSMEAHNFPLSVLERCLGSEVKNAHGAARKLGEHLAHPGQEAQWWNFL